MGPPRPGAWSASRWRRRSDGPGDPVAGLPLAGRPAADQPAGALPRPEPVAEVRLGDLLEHRQVALEVGQDGLALLPGERLAPAGVLLEEPLQGPGNGR